MTPSMLPARYFSLPSIWDDEDWPLGFNNQNGLSISEDEKNVYVEAQVPGIDPNNIDVTFHDGYIWVKGEAQEKEEDKNKKYYRQASRAFSYRVAVPSDIDANKEPEASLKNGVMTVTLPKSPQTQPKKIAIKTD